MDEKQETAGKGFKEGFLARLKAGHDFDDLLAFAREACVNELTLTHAYDALEEVWLEFGFDISSEESTLRDDLEYVMEKLWYERPAARR